MSFSVAISSSCSILLVRPPTDWCGNAKTSECPNEKDISYVCSRFRVDCGSSGRLRSLDRGAIQNARGSSPQDHEGRARQRDAGSVGKSLAAEDAARGKQR